MTFNVTGEFAAGTAGSVIFRRKVWLNDNGALIPPADVTATLAGSPPGFVQALRPTTETGVTPAGWTYEVVVRVTGQEDLVGRMFLTANSDLADVFQFEAPVNGEFYATKGDLSALAEALGNPVSQEYVDDAIADAVDGITIITDALGDDITSLSAADVAADLRLDDLETLTAELEARGYVVNTDGESPVIFIGITDPDLVDPPLDPAPEEGSAWIDTTEAP